MIWRKHRCIFLHVPRTGGTTIEQVLSAPLSPEEHEKGEGVFTKHLDALRAESLWPEFHSPDYRVFTVLREPADLVLSQYIQNRVSPSVGGFNAWVRSLPDIGGIPYLTSAEVDPHLPELVRDIPFLRSAGTSYERFFQTRQPCNITFLSFEKFREQVDGWLLPELGLKPLREKLGDRKGTERIANLPLNAEGKPDVDQMLDDDTREKLDRVLAEDRLFYSRALTSGGIGLR